MDRLKFRGWHDTGKWVYSDENFCDNRDRTVDDNMATFWIAVANKFIDPATVGQWTGLRDKMRTKEYPKGKPIYEGDIVAGFGTQFVVKFGIARRQLRSDHKALNEEGAVNFVDIPSFYFQDPNGVPLYPIVENYKGEHDLETLEVIGSIHDTEGGDD